MSPLEKPMSNAEAIRTLEAKRQEAADFLLSAMRETVEHRHRVNRIESEIAALDKAMAALLRDSHP